MSAIVLLALLVPCIAGHIAGHSDINTVTSWTFSKSCGCVHISETLGPVSCPSTGRDECKAYYNVSYDWPRKQAFKFREEFEELPYIRILDRPSRPYKSENHPPENVTIRAAMIDGIEGTITNVSRFSNVDDAIHALIILEPAWANNTAELARKNWQECGGLNGEWEWMLATYNLSDRGNGASGIVDIYGNSDKMTPAQLIHVLNTIHVTETRDYSKYIGEETVEVRTSPTYQTTYSGPL